MDLEIDSQHIFSEFEDPERQALVESIMNQAGGLAFIPRGSLFPLWFSDISVLRTAADPNQDLFRRSWVRQVQILPMTDFAGVWGGSKQANRPSTQAGLAAPRQTHQARSRSPGTSGVSPRGRSLPRSRLPVPSRGPNMRSSDVREQTLARDNNQCVLTKLLQPTLQVSHIMPFKLNMTTGKVNPMWAWLEAFWGKEKVKDWQEQLLPDPDGSLNTEFIANMMTLGIQVHQYWDNAVCAFRPISVNKEGTSMKVAFHWLPLALKSVRRDELVPVQSHPYSDIPTGFREGPREKEERTTMRLFHQGSGKIIPSGYIFKITTPDPVAKPLPSMALLELKWHLSRIVAMQGAAEEEDSDLDDDHDSVKVPSRSRSRSPQKNPLKENMPIRSRHESLSPGKSQRLSLLSEVSSLEENW
ncbi:hypothetical protein N7468_008864 [Penicillium chermesinum]|uniref:HNH nuclease domain-containing protein n=1 Tax=Penicillium chermesinum TaxID=63820 RepID=A0A9W9NGN2_9EURO|nr:uncharacterized protein N7468_008864 [Penicillium chermesinum]KAJ5219660.1 hypothetical protein N7468_008864 [Penicillium chermesinum]KAJ6153663.1 hypothetical protein N7470_006622 [Penicillium chermesinum]